MDEALQALQALQGLQGLELVDVATSMVPAVARIQGRFSSRRNPCEGASYQMCTPMGSLRWGKVKCSLQQCFNNIWIRIDKFFVRTTRRKKNTGNRSISTVLSKRV